MKRSGYGSPRFDGFRDSVTIHDHEHRPNKGSSCKNRTEASSESDDQSKSELLEVLRHSQTRAREAENVAKEAYAEKEHLVKLLFKQASEIFGYKQWLQLLHLEALYLEIKNKKIENNKEDEPPVSILWSSGKAR